MRSKFPSITTGKQHILDCLSHSSLRICFGVKYIRMNRALLISPNPTEKNVMLLNSRDTWKWEIKLFHAYIHDLIYLYILITNINICHIKSQQSIRKPVDFSGRCTCNKTNKYRARIWGKNPQDCRACSSKLLLDQKICYKTGIKNEKNTLHSFTFELFLYQAPREDLSSFSFE